MIHSVDDVASIEKVEGTCTQVEMGGFITVHLMYHCVCNASTCDLYTCTSSLLSQTSSHPPKKSRSEG